jgi:vacuolar-type H+-ATPase subunit H
MDPDYKLSPLDQIRQAEAEVARRVAGRREAAELTLAQAREHGQALVEAEIEAGQRDGQAQYRRLILRAQDEVRAVHQEGQKHVATIQQNEHNLMDVAVRHVLAIIMGEGEP